MNRLIYIVLIGMLLTITYAIYTLPIPIEAEAEKEGKFYYMNITFYSLHSDCINDKWNDGYTATMTKIRPGVVAINVDLIDGKWEVVSPLRLGDTVLIEELGIFSVEDTGRFSEKDKIQDIYTVDVFEPDHKKAVEGGKEIRKVWVLEEG